ncbi:hypothetical protein SUDANB145_07213 (plasmid) [Streptomyces sp. enrichment culture]|uniref:hypothetical protein n=1 Tax=Streptomyces sp. enrichment culture TaxID=1795815 RepID=UPI003F55A11F
MAARLNSTVYVQDPDTHQTVELAAGTSPEARLAALVTNPAAWVDGKLPRLPKTQTGSQSDSPTGDGQDDASGAASDPADADQVAPAAKKTAARKTAATKPARGRDAADEGSGGA